MDIPVKPETKCLKSDIMGLKFGSTISSGMLFGANPFKAKHYFFNV